MTVHGLRDPFSFLLQELAARDAGLRGAWTPGQREQLVADLLVAEAEESAHGLRHLSVVHGEPVDPVDAEVIDDLVVSWRDELAAAEAAGAVENFRLGGSDVHVTITVGGVEADRWIAWATDVALRCGRPAWRVLETARV